VKRNLSCEFFGLLVLGLVGCGASARSHPAGTPWLDRVEIHGNQALTDADLRDGMALETAREHHEALDPYELEIDSRRIRGAYLRLGYFDVKVTSRIVRDDDAITVVFDIAEGARSTTLVSIQGLPPDIPEERARAVVAIADGDPFDYVKYDEAKLPLEKLLQDAGYAHERLEATVVADRQRKRAAVRYLFEPGPRALFGPVTIEGVDAYPDLRRAIEKRLTFQSGEVYSASALLSTQRALYNFGRFSTVSVSTAEGAGDVLAVKITVVPATPLELKFGGGIGWDPLNWEARLRVAFTDVPVSAPLWTFTVEGRAGITALHEDAYAPQLGQLEPKVRALASAQRLELLRRDLRGDLGAGGDYITVETYTSTGPLARAGLAYPLRPWLQARVGWQFQYLWFRNVAEFADPTTVITLGLDQPERLGVFQQNLVADRRDNPGEPHRGWFVDVRVNEGTRAAGGAFEYIQVTPDARAYIPLGPLTLALRARLGTIVGAVPVTERYFAGGASSHRGFATRQLSPRAFVVTGEDDLGNPTLDAVPIGGAALLEVGPELRIPLGLSLGPVELGLNLFLDGGDVTNDVNTLDPANLFWATGVGLSGKVYGIKAHLDFGYRLNRLDATDFPLVVNFGLGEAF